MVCTYDFSGNCGAIRLWKPEIFEYRGFSPRITANSRDRELSLPQFALFVLFLPRLLRYTRQGCVHAKVVRRPEVKESGPRRVCASCHSSKQRELLQSR